MKELVWHHIFEYLDYEDIYNLSQLSPFFELTVKKFNILSKWGFIPKFDSMSEKKVCHLLSKYPTDEWGPYKAIQKNSMMMLTFFEEQGILPNGNSGQLAVSLGSFFYLEWLEQRNIFPYDADEANDLTMIIWLEKRNILPNPEEVERLKKLHYA